MQALYESAETGKAVAIPPFREAQRPTGRQRITRPGVRKPALVKVQSASVRLSGPRAREDRRRHDELSWRRSTGWSRSIETAMMTTRRADGHLRSRAMANQKRAAGADLWFVCADGTAKLADLASDPHVNLTYYRDSNREWVSVSGLATRDARSREDPRALRAATGRRGSPTRAIRATARPTIRGWC